MYIFFATFALRQLYLVMLYACACSVIVYLFLKLQENLAFPMYLWNINFISIVIATLLWLSRCSRWLVKAMTHNDKALVLLVFLIHDCHLVVSVLFFKYYMEFKFCFIKISMFIYKDLLSFIRCMLSTCFCFIFHCTNSMGDTDPDFKGYINIAHILQKYVFMHNVYFICKFVHTT